MAPRPPSRVALFVLAVLFAAFSAAAEGPGDWRRLGEAGDWRETLAGVVSGGKLYSVESDGYLYRTDLGDGRWRPVGQPDFGETRHLFSADGVLWSIEKDGSLYRISPADGTWKRKGAEGGWARTVALCVLGPTLYTVNADGRLLATDLSRGTSSAIGTRDFSRTSFLFPVGEDLGSIEEDGSLYRIDPVDGTREQVGGKGTWRDTVALAALGGKVYTVEKSGRLYETDPRDGSWRAIGDADFAQTRFLFAGEDRLFSIEADGSLYEVQVR